MAEAKNWLRDNAYTQVARLGNEHSRWQHGKITVLLIDHADGYALLLLAGDCARLSARLTRLSDGGGRIMAGKGMLI